MRAGGLVEGHTLGMGETAGSIPARSISFCELPPKHAKAGFWNFDGNLEEFFLMYAYFI
jgi:hypothetical protein